MPDDGADLASTETWAEHFLCLTHEELMESTATMLDGMADAAERRGRDAARVHVVNLRDIASLLRSAATRLEVGA